MADWFVLHPIEAGAIGLPIILAYFMLIHHFEKKIKAEKKLQKQPVERDESEEWDNVAFIS